jgi:hypothetical protein
MSQARGVRAALAACDSPVEALRLAFDNTDNRRAVVAEGVQAAAVLDTGLGATLLRALAPWPSPLEVAEQWSVGKLYWTSSDDTWRMLLYVGVLGLMPTLAFGLVIGPRLALSKNARGIIIVVIIHAGAVGGMWLWNRVQQRLLRRLAARLDEQTAFAIVHAELTRRVRVGGSRKDWAWMMSMLRHGLDKLIREPTD